jgi:hypothetical protein
MLKVFPNKELGAKTLGEASGFCRASTPAEDGHGFAFADHILFCFHGWRVGLFVMVHTGWML